MLDYNRLIELRNSFKKLDDFGENNVKMKIVVEVLKSIGYDICDMNFETKAYDRDRIVDIKININGNESLHVETKRGDEELKEKDIMQLLDYLNRETIEWGILSNGKKYVLINRNISQTTIEDLIVLDLNLFSDNDLKYMKYLTKESIFDSKVTEYFKDIAQFKALKYPGRINKSWISYRSTLFCFFDYFSEKENKYRPLEEIRTDDFEDFLKKDQQKKVDSNKKINSIQTFNNKYSHIRSMLNELKKNKKINSHHFEQERKYLIKNFSVIPKQNINHLAKENIEKIVEFLKTNDKSVRDLAIFLLCIYFGIERSLISTLNWNMIDFDKKILKLNNREIPIPNNLLNTLKTLEHENRKNKIKGNHLFYAYYDNHFNIMKEGSINQVFNKLRKINEDVKWKEFSPQYIRNNLIKVMYNKGFSIDEICFFTGTDLPNIANIISFDEIISKVRTNKNKLIEKHPFIEFL